MTGRFEELEATMDRYGISRCNIFCLDEPDRHPGFRAGNDRTLDFAARSNGRLIPFVRLDLTEAPIEEAERCLDRGARGIKLHPRAQKFLLDDERLAPVFAIAAERRVPILIHGGRGLPPIADNLYRLVHAYPEAQLIIAHAGIADLSGLASRFAGKAGVFFDTSVWSAIDLLGFFHRAAGAGLIRVRLSVRLAAELAAHLAPDGPRIGADRAADPRHAGRQRESHRRRRAPGRAVDCTRVGDLVAADAARSHTPVPVDGVPAAHHPAAGLVRRARPRA